jgi:glucokinase
LLVTLGTGIGGGIVLNGKIYNGFNSAGGELGHTIFVHGGKSCTCGNKGCWEVYASVTALIAQTKEAMDKNPESLMHKLSEDAGKVSGRTAFDAAKAGDKAGAEVVRQYLEYVASGLVGIVNIFQPGKLIIGGGISKEGDYLLNPIIEYIRERDYNKYMPKTEIGIAKLFNDAGIIGAALACIK